MNSGPGLSDHLKVPLPFLLYRAQVRYEEDLRVLQGNLGASTALAPPRPGLDIKATERSAVSTPTRTPLSLRGSPLPPVSRHATPIAIPKNRIITQRASPHGLQSSQYLLRNSPITASTATLQARLSPSRPVPSSPLTVRRAPSPPSSHSPSSSSGDEDEDRKEENREEVDRQLKTLEKMMSSQLLGFARPKVDISKARERLNASMIKASTKLDKLDSPQKLTPTSSIPSIPSPPPEMKTESSPVGAIRGSAPVSPAVRPPGQGARNKATGRNPTMHSHHGSSASSFSDISGKMIWAISASVAF